MEARIQTRPIRSFVRREGRLTPGQKRALKDLLPRYGIEFSDDYLNFSTLFGTEKAVTLEIGFGNGESLAQMAREQPEQRFIGVEVHRPGVGHLLQLIEQNQLTNIRVICADAVEVIKSMIPAESLHTVQLFFPDPWPKKRHHKRRIIKPVFAQLIAEKLKPDGTFHIATDWENYAEAALEVIKQSNCFKNLSTTSTYISRPVNRPLTKFEQRGQKLGHGVWDLMFQRNKNT
jgi:tRNA (guanine-N7-)-methyltransferase